MYAIEAENLTKKFGELPAVDGIDLKIKKGEVFGLVGPDGAGKTTTIRVFSTILEPTGGWAKVAGLDVAKQAEAVKGRIGYMSQRFNLYGDLTVKENLEFFADVYQVKGKERAAKMEELMTFSRLEKFLNYRAEHLSGGMKQKLALSCTLIHEPEVIFLDEPTTGVDPVSRRELWRILSRLHAKGVTLFVTTPYMDEAERCTTVAFMLDGKIIEADRPAKIKARLAGEIIELAVAPLRQASEVLKEKTFVRGIEVYGNHLQITVGNAAEAIPLIRKALEEKGLEARELDQISPTMENAFVRLIKDYQAKPKQAVVTQGDK